MNESTSGIEARYPIFEYCGGKDSFLGRGCFGCISVNPNDVVSATDHRLLRSAVSMHWVNNCWFSITVTCSSFLYCLFWYSCFNENRFFFLFTVLVVEAIVSLSFFLLNRNRSSNAISECEKKRREKEKKREIKEEHIVNYRKCRRSKPHQELMCLSNVLILPLEFK